MGVLGAAMLKRVLSGGFTEKGDSKSKDLQEEKKWRKHA